MLVVIVQSTCSIIALIDVIDKEPNRLFQFPVSSYKKKSIVFLDENKKQIAVFGTSKLGDAQRFGQIHKDRFTFAILWYYKSTPRVYSEGEWKDYTGSIEPPITHRGRSYARTLLLNDVNSKK
jgi:hypothetical protein